MLLNLDWAKVGKDDFYNLIYIINRIRYKNGTSILKDEITDADIITETENLNSIFCFDSTDYKDVAEFKALVMCANSNSCIPNNLALKADLFSIFDVVGFCGKPAFNHKGKFVKTFKHFWELVKACPTSSQKKYLDKCEFVNCGEQSKKVNEYIDLVIFCQKLMSVPPYPDYGIIEKYAPKSDEREGNDKSPRELRADAVDSYVYTHMENSNLNDVLVKVCLVDAMYSAQLEQKTNYETMAKHIIKFRTKGGAAYLDVFDSLKEYKWNVEAEERKFIDMLINYIRDVDFKNLLESKHQGVYSFATKYLHCHNKDYPIWDRNVDRIFDDWQTYYSNWCASFPKYPKIDVVDKVSHHKYTYFDYLLYVKGVWAKILGEQHKDDCSLDRFDAAIWTLGNKVYNFKDPDNVN